MKIDQLLNSITPEAYENLKYAVETGRWSNGEKLTSEQRDNCLQTIIAYDLKHREEVDRVGYIDRREKGRGGSSDWQPLRLDEIKDDS